MRQLLLSLFAANLTTASLTCQSWHNRAIRPDVHAVHSEGGPNGTAAGFRGRQLVIWSSGAWMPFAELPSTFGGLGGIVYDRVRATTVVLSSTALGWQTLEWSPGGWVVHAVPPPSSELHYDPALGGVVAFTHDFIGGTTQDYLWNGATWVALAANVRPLHVGRQVAPDHNRSRMVAFTNLGSGAGGQTWEWDGVVWTQMAPAISPAARNARARTFHSAATALRMLPTRCHSAST